MKANHMKQIRVYQVILHCNKGFLLLEIIIALFLLITTVSGIALYQAHTHMLCADAKKRHQAIALTDTVLETLSASGSLIASTVHDGITVTISPIISPNILAYDGIFAVTTSWNTTAGLPLSISCITYMSMV